MLNVALIHCGFEVCVKVELELFQLLLTQISREKASM